MKKWLLVVGYLVAVSCRLRKDGEPRSRQTKEHDFYCLWFQDMYSFTR